MPVSMSYIFKIWLKYNDDKRHKQIATTRNHMKMKYIFVQCVTSGRQLWIDKKYVELYPQLYKPVYYKNIPIEADVV